MRIGGRRKEEKKERRKERRNQGRVEERERRERKMYILGSESKRKFYCAMCDMGVEGTHF